MAVTSNLSFLGKIGTIDRGLGIYNFSAQFPPCIYYWEEARSRSGDVSLYILLYSLTLHLRVNRKFGQKAKKAKSAAGAKPRSEVGIGVRMDVS